MTLIERLRARLTYLRNEADAAYFRDAADALDAAQAMAEAITHSPFCNAFGPTPMDCSCSHAEALAKFQEAMK